MVFLPGALNRFVFPKLAAAAAGVAVAFRSPERGRLPRPVWIVVGVGLATLPMAALLGADPLHQLIGEAPRYEGLLTALLYVGAAATGARLLGPDRSRDADRLLLRLLVAAALAVALLALAETLGMRPLESDVSRPGSLLGNASDQGAWALLALGPLLWAAVRMPSRLVIAGATAAAAAVVLSGSRGALLGALVLLAVLVLAFPQRRAVARLAAVAGGLVVVALAVPAVRDRLLGQGLAGTTVGGRALLWQETWALYLRHPVLGVGPGGFGEAIRSAHDSRWYADLGTDNPPDSPHSWPLELLLAGGPLLLAVALVGVGLLARAVWRHVSALTEAGSLAPGLAAGLAGYGTALLVHFTGPGHTPLAALYAGALLAVPPVRGAARSAADRAVTLAGALLAGLAALGAIAEIPLRSAVVALQSGDLVAADARFSTAQTLRWWDPAVAVVAGHAFAVTAETSGDTDALHRADRWLTSSVLPGAVPVSVLTDLGRVREAAGDLAGAATALDRGLREDPANPDLLLERGIVAARQQDWTTAEARFRAAARSAPSSAAPWRNLAKLYELTRRPADAAAATARATHLAG